MYINNNNNFNNFDITSQLIHNNILPNHVQFQTIEFKVSFNRFWIKLQFQNTLKINIPDSSDLMASTQTDHLNNLEII